MNSHHFKNLITLNDSLQRAIHNHYRSRKLQYVDVPQIVGITGACENIDTLFRIGNRQKIPLFFTQTGQLALEQALQYSHGVYTIIQSGRDEEIEDERHLRQFRLTEEETDWTMNAPDGTAYNEEGMYEALLVNIEQAVKDIAISTITENLDLLETAYQRDTSAVLQSLQHRFLRISYEDAVELLKKNGFAELTWGDDLKAEHEARVLKLLNDHERQMHASLPAHVDRPLLIMRYPKEIKFFNMKVSEKDSRVVLSADLIFPFAGEGVGSAVREHDANKLRAMLMGSTMFRLHKERGGTYDDFVWYVDGLVGAKKTTPHAGYGLGNERLLQYILGKKDIRECSLFHLMAQQTHDWDKKPNTTP